MQQKTDHSPDWAPDHRLYCLSGSGVVGSPSTNVSSKRTCCVIIQTSDSRCTMTSLKSKALAWSSNCRRASDLVIDHFSVRKMEALCPLNDCGKYFEHRR